MRLHNQVVRFNILIQSASNYRAIVFFRLILSTSGKIPRESRHEFNLVVHPNPKKNENLLLSNLVSLISKKQKKTSENILGYLE